MLLNPAEKATYYEKQTCSHETKEKEEETYLSFKPFLPLLKTCRRKMEEGKEAAIRIPLARRSSLFSGD